MLLLLMIHCFRPACESSADVRLMKIIKATGSVINKTDLISIMCWWVHGIKQTVVLSETSLKRLTHE